MSGEEKESLRKTSITDYVDYVQTYIDDCEVLRF